MSSYHQQVVLVAMVMAIVSPWLRMGVHPYPSFPRLIPNGENVNSPCIPFFKVRGVGHESPFGGGARNNFGRDFSAAGTTWTQALCEMDSDGDGRTNGEELGDPDCVWNVGATPSRTILITHPGIANNRPGCIRRLFAFLL